KERRVILRLFQPFRRYPPEFACPGPGRKPRREPVTVDQPSRLRIRADKGCRQKSASHGRQVVSRLLGKTEEEEDLAANCANDANGRIKDLFCAHSRHLRNSRLNLPPLFTVAESPRRSRRALPVSRVPVRVCKPRRVLSDQ